MLPGLRRGLLRGVWLERAARSGVMAERCIGKLRLGERPRWAAAMLSMPTQRGMVLSGVLVRLGELKFTTPLALPHRGRMGLPGGVTASVSGERAPPRERGDKAAACAASTSG